MTKKSAFISTPTLEAYNLEKYWEVVRKCDPELYLIKCVLTETGIAPMILPRIIRSLYNMAIGTKYGKVQIFMQNGVITMVKGEESDSINMKAREEGDGK